MKTSFIPTRGHNYHVVHETKTGAMRRRAYTLCGDFFESGELSTHQPTCPNCRKLDNPLMLDSQTIQYLRDVATIVPWRDAPVNGCFHALVERDYITVTKKLTRRGQILVDDFSLGAIPLEDNDRVMHARKPLDKYPLCHKNGRLRDANDMTVSRYEKLRKLEDSIVVTCLSCLGK